MPAFAFELNECDLENSLGKRLGLASSLIPKTATIPCAFFGVHKGEVGKNK